MEPTVITSISSDSTAATFLYFSWISNPLLTLWYGLNLVGETQQHRGTMFAVERAIQRIHTAVGAPRLTKFTLHAPKRVEVEFAEGSVFNLSAEFLRVQSPAVDAKVRSIGGEKVISGRRHVGIMSAEPVGNYGVRIIFDDLHKTGIYPWNYFYQLGSNKFTLMRNYIKTLKKHGLSRDPSRRK